MLKRKQRADLLMQGKTACGDMRGPDEIIAAHVEAGNAARKRFCEQNAASLRAAARMLAIALARGNKILLCGNGGSAADCQHVAAEFVNRFLTERPGLAAIALTTDTSAITAIGNDRSFDDIFARQVDALGASGDVLVAISTSGASPNVLAAVAAARQKNMRVIALTGAGGPLAENADIALAVPDKGTPVIQEAHLMAEHLLCRLTDYFLFENSAEIADAIAGGEV